MTDKKAVVSYEEMLRDKAKAAAATEAQTGGSIGLKGGIITFAGKEVPDNKLDCIVIASTYANMYYPTKWVDGDKSPPTCYAYADVEAQLRPHPKSTDPQAASCLECQWNKFGTADNGKGKKCRNSRHLAVIPPDTTAENVSTTEAAVIKLPVTSVAAWSQYVNKLDMLFSRPPFAVITQVTTKPDAKTTFKVHFNKVGDVGADVGMKLMEREESAKLALHREYGTSEAVPEKNARIS